MIRLAASGVHIYRTKRCAERMHKLLARMTSQWSCLPAHVHGSHNLAAVAHAGYTALQSDTQLLLKLAAAIALVFVVHVLYVHTCDYS